MYAFARWFSACLLTVAALHGETTVSDSRYAHLARGINLTRWFQYNDSVPIAAPDRDLLQKAGFTFVRIPVAPQHLLRDWSSPQRIARTLSDLDRGIDLFLDAGVAVILDFHADKPYLDSYLNRSGSPEELIDVWRLLALRYADRDPDLLFFEIMNEPDNRFSEPDWDAEQQKVLAAIHSAAPQHTVLLNAVNWSGLDALTQMTPYSDPNVIYVLHYYSPTTFTHQGADWTGQPDLASLRDVPWPAFDATLETLIDRETSPATRTRLQQYQAEDWNASRIEWDMGLAAAWTQRWGVRVLVDEFGDFKPFAPAESRARWLRDVRLAMEKQHLGWAMWDYAAGFDLTLLNHGVRTIDPLIEAALGLGAYAGSWTLPEPARGRPLPPFSSLRTLQIGPEPDNRGYAESILAADIDRDGAPDLVLTPSIYPALPALPVEFLLNNGTGLLTPGSFDGPVPLHRFVPSIVSGHFLRSSDRPGFFLADAGPPDGSGAQSELLLPSGKDRLRDGTQGLPSEIVRTTGAAAGDIDGDGLDDLAVFHDGVELLRNDGNAHFRIQHNALPVSGNFRCGAFVPRPGASVPDLLVFGARDTPGRVFFNEGVGGFRDGGLLPFPLTAGRPALGGCATVGDLDGDGKPDVIVAFTQPNALQILMNNGNGTFRDETAQRLAALPAITGEIRRVALRRPHPRSAWTLLITRVGKPPLIEEEKNNGSFTPADVPPDGEPWVVGAADFNRDGLLDLVFGRGGGAPAEVRLGQSAR